MTGPREKFCEQCGARLKEGVRFCEQCGAQVQAASVPPAPSAPPVAKAVDAPAPQAAVTWETGISLLGNPLIRKQLALVVIGSGAFMALLLSFLVAAGGDADQIPMMLRISLYVTLGLGLMLVLVSLVFFGNRVRVRFTVDENGALWETVDKRALTGNRLALLGSALQRSPQAGGAAMLAAAREREFVRWSDVAAAQADRRHLMITLRNSWRPVMLLVCTPENFDEIAALARSRAVAAPAVAAPGEPAPRRRPLRSGKGRTVLAALAATPLFMLPSFLYSFDIFLPLLTFLFALATVWLMPIFGWVVIGGVGVLAVQLAWLGAEEFDYMWGDEQVVFILAYVGLAYLAWFAWRSLRGRIIPPLLQG